MLVFLARRLLSMIPTLLGITLITYAIITAAPGDPLELATGSAMDEQVSTSLDKLKAQYGLDRPWYEQYYNWLSKLVQLDFGTSFKDKRPVLGKILERVPRTVVLNLISILLVYGISIPVGIYSAVFHRSWFDKVTGVTFFIMFSIPSFWLAMLLQRQFGVVWRLLPIYDLHSINIDGMSFPELAWDYMKHAILITVCLSVNSFAYISRFMRAVVRENLNQDYVRTARSKGLAERVVILRHVLSNSMIPLVTLFSALLPSILSGSVLLEMIFNWPGLGQLFFEAILTRDYPTIMANSVISAVLILISLVLADLLYAVVDPRVRLE